MFQFEEKFLPFQSFHPVELLIFELSFFSEGLKHIIIMPECENVFDFPKIIYLHYLLTNLNFKRPVVINK